MSKDQKKEENVVETHDAAEREEISAENGEAGGNAAPSLEDQLAAAQEESAVLKDQMLRLAADFENYKKRSERERAAAMKYAGEYIFRDMLPVVDNLERAIQLGVVEGVGAEKNLAALLEGVELTLKSLKTSLEKFEVKPVESVGGLFDPNKQEALTMEASDTVPANHVLTEFEKGYFFKDRLLRAAKVIVSSGKAES